MFQDANFTNTIANIKDLLTGQHKTIAAAESVTSGLVQAALCTAQEASLFFQGGITTYNIGQKTRHLHIDAIHAMRCDCVSEYVAKQMALSVCTLFSCDWGLGITGYAAPVPQSDQKIFAYYAIACDNKIVVSEKIIPQADTPLNIQLHYVKCLLKSLENCLRKQ